MFPLVLRWRISKWWPLTRTCSLFWFCSSQSVVEPLLLIDPKILASIPIVSIIFALRFSRWWPCSIIFSIQSVISLAQVTALMFCLRDLHIAGLQRGQLHWCDRIRPSRASSHRRWVAHIFSARLSHFRGTAFWWLWNDDLVFWACMCH